MLVGVLRGNVLRKEFRCHDMGGYRMGTVRLAPGNQMDLLVVLVYVEPTLHDPLKVTLVCMSSPLSFPLLKGKFVEIVGKS